MVLVALGPLVSGLRASYLFGLQWIKEEVTQPQRRHSGESSMYRCTVHYLTKTSIVVYCMYCCTDPVPRGTLCNVPE